jgi:hypothetical protein
MIDTFHVAIARRMSGGKQIMANPGGHTFGSIASQPTFERNDSSRILIAWPKLTSQTTAATAQTNAASR